MLLRIKLTKANHLLEEGKENDLSIINSIDDGREHSVIITTNKLQIERDKKDQRNISAIKGIKLVYGLADGGCAILMGNLGCSFRQPFGGEFYVTKAVLEGTCEFDAISGVHEQIKFTSCPMDISSMQSFLEVLAKDPKLEFNLSQFDEFMDLFKFYKELSDELNNNVTYPISYMSESYFFVPISEKDIEVEEDNAVYNLDGLIVGYKLDEYKYEMLSSEQKDRVLSLRDIEISGDETDIKKSKKIYR